MSARLHFMLLPLLLPILGCDSMSQGPTAPPARITAPASEARAPGLGSIGRFPLVLGASWTYAGTEWTRERPAGQADFGSATPRRFTRVASAVRLTDFPGTEYVVIENVTTFEGGPGPFMSRQYLRQDDAALYSFPDAGGLAGLVIARSASPAPRPSETILLVHPLHVGSEWSAAPTSYLGTPGEGSTFTVEAIEPIRTPMGVEPAGRVRAQSERMLSGRQPDLTWFGRSGVVRTWKRSISPYSRPNGERGERERTTEEQLVAVTGL